MQELLIVLFCFFVLPYIYWKGIILTANFADKFSDFLIDKFANL
jgi:hypothetical protein